MTSVHLRPALERHAVAIYYLLAFGISWAGLVLGFGPGVFLGTTAISLTAASPLAYVAYLAGPAAAGIALVAVAHGRPGLRALLSRMLRWRVGLRWYAVALLTAPALNCAITFVLSRIYPEYLPAIITTDNKIGLLVMALSISLVVPLGEETGWTGFAVPQLRMRHGTVSTGLFVGVLWGLWHLPLFTAQAASSQYLPPALYLAVLLFSWLVPYRILMVWVYDRTKSLFMVMVMHLAIDIGLILVPTTATDVAIPADLALGAALWVCVALTTASRLRVAGQRRAALPA